MPRISLQQPGQPVANFSIDGSTVTVAGVSIDCAQRQRDSKVTVEIRSIGGVAAEGATGAYLAQIEIPAREYEAIQFDAETAQEDGAPINSRALQPIALNPNAILVTLWPAA